MSLSRSTSATTRQEKKRRKSRLINRLRRYEELLKNHGEEIEHSDLSDSDGFDGGSEGNEMEFVGADEHRLGKHTVTSPAPKAGRLIVKHGMSRYLDNALWTGLAGELQDPKELLQDSSEDEISAGIQTMYLGRDLITGLPPSQIPLASLHPQPVQIFRLWQAFLDNVYPLIKIFHGPTVQQMILEASANVESMSKSVEPLMFGIYGCAVLSLKNEQCETIMGETKSSLLNTYRVAAHETLLRAGYLKSSDITVLQAYVLFLICTRPGYDPRSFWILTGIAIRIAQRIGLHHDGTTLSLSIFETELRRRLWWQICTLDGRAAQLSGAGTSVVAQSWDTQLPLNVNDSALSPEMSEPPMETPGTTEMLFCLLRYETGMFNREFKPPVATFDGPWQGLSGPRSTIIDKEKRIRELEQKLESKYLRYCDPLIPLHFISSIVGRSILCQMRLKAYQLRLGQAGAGTEEERNMLFENSLKMIEYDNLVYSTERTQRFLWHVKNHFQIEAFVHILNQLRRHPATDQAEKAWQQIKETFGHHPEMITDKKNAVIVAIRHQTLSAWQKRETNFASRGESMPAEPQYISTLRSLMKGNQTTGVVDSFGNQRQFTSQMGPSAEGPFGGMSTIFDGPNSQSGSLPVEWNSMDWSFWNEYLQAFEFDECQD